MQVRLSILIVQITNYKQLLVRGLPHAVAKRSLYVPGIQFIADFKLPVL
jgi:hypothetical protein